MKKNIRYFLAQTFYNIKNAHALTKSFWIGVASMVLNNTTFFVIWFLFMQATGPIHGWTSIDVFGMLGISMIAFGFTHGLLYGIVDLPQSVLRGSFDGVLLSPRNMFIKISGSAFSVTAYGDLLMGLAVAIFYGIYLKFTVSLWIVYVVSICLGCVIFASVRLLCSLVVFYIHDGDVISTQLFEIFLRPGLYPGSVFPNKLKLFFMTVVPTLITSAVPVDIIKQNSVSLFLSSILITLIWVCITYFIFMRAIRRYESGNFLR